MAIEGKRSIPWWRAAINGDDEYPAERIRDGTFSAIERLVMEGKEVNETQIDGNGGYYGETLLHNLARFCAFEGSQQSETICAICHLLIQNKANVNERTRFTKKRPIDYARDFPRYDALVLLLEQAMVDGCVSDALNKSEE